jgi:hypothetical protein
MMDRLEKFVTEHREEFDVYEPNEGLWERIRKPEVSQIKTISWFWKAAILLLVFGASFWAQQHMKDQKQQILVKDNRTNPEMAIPELAEANKYYNGLIQAKLSEVQKALVSYPEIKKDMRHELSELDSVFQSLKNDLKDNISNPEIIEAMIQNYRLKLNLLEQIQTELQEQNSKNSTKKERHEAGKSI